MKNLFSGERLNAPIGRTGDLFGLPKKDVIPYLFIKLNMMLPFKFDVPSLLIV